MVTSSLPPLHRLLGWLQTRTDGRLGTITDHANGAVVADVVQCWRRHRNESVMGKEQRSGERGGYGSRSKTLDAKHAAGFVRIVLSGGGPGSGAFRTNLWRGRQRSAAPSVKHPAGTRHGEQP